MLEYTLSDVENVEEESNDWLLPLIISLSVLCVVGNIEKKIEFFKSFSFYFIFYSYYNNGNHCDCQKNVQK